MNCTHQIKNNDMGDTCSMNEGQVHVGFCWGNPRERNNLEDLGMDGRIILNSNYYPSATEGNCCSVGYVEINT